MTRKELRVVLFLTVSLLASISWSAAHGHEVRLDELPLGDGQIASEPTQGSVYACRTRFNANAPGAHRTGDWLGSDSFDLTRKPTVDGAVTHLSELSITRGGAVRRITGNGLPDHPTGTFPIQRSDDAFTYDRNPGTIRAQRIDVALPAEPQPADTAGCLPMGAIGIMTSGSVLFNALDARGDDALAHEILDDCQGHPQRDGVYHYHGKSPCIDGPAAIWDHSGLVGYALDGFGIYGFQGEDGHALSTDELDECHGHVGTVEWDGADVEMYHYHATPDFPYTVSCFKGTPVNWSLGAGGGPGRHGRPGRHR